MSDYVPALVPTSDELAVEYLAAEPVQPPVDHAQHPAGVPRPSCGRARPLPGPAPPPMRVARATAARTYLVFDTETTDLLPNARHPDRNPRLLSLAWGLYDAWGRTLDEQYHLVRPVGFTIDETGGAFRKHRITQAQASRDGRPRAAVLAPFLAALRGAHAIVAHNLPFDREIVRREVASRHRAAVADAPGWCAMEVADMADAPEPNAPRWMHGLAYLYEWAFGEELRPPGGAHHARDDMRACARLFFAFRPSGFGMIGPETNRPDFAAAAAG